MQSVEAAGSRLLDMHIKDLKSATEKDSQCAVGEGVMPVVAIFKQLKKMKYQGCVNLEYEINAENPLPGMQRSIGYLKGVPFWWIVQHCWLAWSVALLSLLLTFYLVDRHNFRRAPTIVGEEESGAGKIRIDGLRNIFFLAIILGALFVERPPFLRDWSPFQPGRCRRCPG